MCELLAMSCRHPARLTSSLTALAAHAGGESRNRDGWGLAFYQGYDVALYRDTTPANTCPLVPWLEANGPATTLSLGYIRHATQGILTLANTGPFLRELNGRMHVFTHNGNLKPLATSSPGTSGLFQPVGESDSELAFCLLLDQIRKLAHARGALPTLQARLDTVAEVALALRVLGPASFLYADGDVLFAHADRRRQPLTGQVTAPALYRLDCPAGKEALLVRDSESAEMITAQRVILLASVPLTQEVWAPLQEGEVLAIREGEVVASLQL
ncbi:class II glutamine amidotransferase [Vreelandella andesensis]|uniref:Class II glutamine amidotransferase n=1 Tax=Vreelandella andesensis TaxID=447567 RepID=A0A3S0Y2B7_9GAMM|nr:class II glutamine amidotransferase [Halomonas andesensis]RUR28345.1 class II glutamine amidotransferase [Halomonas andesensis]